MKWLNIYQMKALQRLQYLNLRKLFYNGCQGFSMDAYPVECLDGGELLVEFQLTHGWLFAHNFSLFYDFWGFLQGYKKPLVYEGKSTWAMRDSNPRPPACKCRFWLISGDAGEYPDSWLTCHHILHHQMKIFNFVWKALNLLAVAD